VAPSENISSAVGTGIPLVRGLFGGSKK